MTRKLTQIRTKVHPLRAFLKGLIIVAALLTTSFAYGQQTVNGTITNESGETIPGVNILLKGTTTGTVTDVDGNYSLSVPDGNATLVVSFIGFISQEVSVNGQSMVNVSMTEDVTSLQEVVVTGYATQQRKDLTGAVASVSNEDITALPVTNVATALQGRAAGVYVTENSGRPGTSSKVVIRGIGTVGVSNPLYVIDGLITTDINQVNPNDIASIDVLKDAAAGAIYGARAANGVVVITTKRGHEGKLKVSFNTYYGHQTVNSDDVEFVNAEEYVAQQNNGNDFNGQPSQWPNPPEFYRDKSTDFWGLAWRDGYITDTNLSVSGGNSTSQYLVSMGYLKNKGNQIGQEYDRYTLRINTDHKISKRLKLGQSLQVSRANEVAIGGAGSFGGPINGAKVMSPTIFPEILDDGSFNGPTQPGEGVTFITFNPRQYASEWDDLTKRWQIMGNIYAEVELYPGLTFRSTLSGLYNNDDRTQWQPQLEAGLAVGNPTTLFRNTNTLTNWQWDNILTYTRTIDKHTFTILGGYLAQEETFETLNVNVGGFLDESVQVISAGDAGTLKGGGQIFDWSINSIIGRIDYAYDDKYLLQANIRRDGSSRFGPDNRWGTFPSFSAGWRITREDFFNVSGINELKLRASWGMLGNDQVGLYPFASTLNLATNYTLGVNQTILGGAAPLSLANEDVKWEETTQFDIGIDLGLLDNRLYLNLDWFKRTTNDMLLQVPVPSSSGFVSAPFVNAGTVENAGFELAATYRNAEGVFNWDLGLNLGTVNNEITELGNGEAIILGNPANGGYHIADVGTEVYAFYGYVADGLYQNQAEVDAVGGDAYDGGIGPGAVRFKDINGDGTISNDDRTVIGSPYADFTFGLTFGAQYKGFDFTFFVQGSQGADIMIAPNDNFENQPGGNLKYNLTRWQNEGDTNDPRLWGWQGFQNASGGRDGRVGSQRIFDGSYIRGKNISLGYTFKNSLTSRWGLERLRVYVSTKNIFTVWDRPYTNSFFDPELGTESGAGNDGIVGGFGKYNLNATPQPKTVLFGLNIDF